MTDAKTPEHLDRQAVQDIFDASPFISTLNLEVGELNYDTMEISVRMPMQASFERRAGTAQFHGGPLAAFMDVVGDFAIGMLVGGGVPTMNLRIDYLKPAIGATVTGTAKVRRRGRSMAVVDIDVSDEKGALVAVGRGTYVPITG